MLERRQLGSAPDALPPAESPRHLHRLMPFESARAGDSLILTKPLGLGIISTAIKRELATQKMIDDSVEIMTTLNKNAAEIMVQVGVNACTDVTGYGLLGHLLEMCKGSKLSAEIIDGRQLSKLQAF